MEIGASPKTRLNTPSPSRDEKQLYNHIRAVAPQKLRHVQTGLRIFGKNQF
jgi:hypothetical protein